MPRKKKEQQKLLAITWKRSTIGFAADQHATIVALGLHRLNETVEKGDSPAIRGMINKVRHLVEVIEK